MNKFSGNQKPFFQKLKHRFLVESTNVESTSFPYKTAMTKAKDKTAMTKANGKTAMTKAKDKTAMTKANFRTNRMESTK